MVPQEISLEEKLVHVPTPMIQEPFFSIPAVVAPTVEETVVATPVVSSPVTSTQENEDPVFQEPIEPVVTNEEEQQQPHIENMQINEPSRRSQRVRRSAIPDDYEVYVSEDIQLDGDPTTFEEAMRSPHASKWLEAMEDEMRSMNTNKVWELEEIPKGVKTVGCKWVYKTKCDSKGNVERYKARLVAKGFTQREGIDYNETFSPVSCKDSFRIIMALVAHYNLELHQMDVKTAFLNGDLYENVYMAQPKGFVMEGKENMGCRLKKSIYGLK